MKRQGPRLSSHLGRTPFGYQGVTSWSEVRHQREIFLKTWFVWFQSLCSFDSSILSQGRYLWLLWHAWRSDYICGRKLKQAYFLRANALSIMTTKSCPLTVKSWVHSVLLVEAQRRRMAPLMQSWDLPLLDAGPGPCVWFVLFHIG